MNPIVEITRLNRRVEELQKAVQHWRRLAYSTHGEVAKENERLRDELQIARNRIAQNERTMGGGK